MLKSRMLCAIVLAYILTILPLPPILQMVRPAWILLLVLYVQTYIPKYFHVLGVLFLGFFLDALLGTSMGEHAFALVITTWMLVSRTQRFMFFSVLQQMLWVGLACFCYQLILFIAEAAFGYATSKSMMIGVTMSTMLCWPLLVHINLQGVKDVR